MAAPGIKAVIFDCFGVLYTDAKQSFLDIASPEKRTELADLFTSNNYGYFDHASYVNQLAEIVGLSNQEVEQYIAQEHTLNHTLVSLITDQLRPAYKVGLLSNIGRGWMEQFFDTHQLHELFDQVVLSGDEGVAKPNPAIFKLMAERLELHPSECLMIDDIAENCEGAEWAGMSAIHYTDNPQLLDRLLELGIIR